MFGIVTSVLRFLSNMRLFNTVIMAACSAFLLASCCSAEQKECCPAEKEMAIQLYSARDLIGNAEKYAANHEQVRKALAEI